MKRYLAAAALVVLPLSCTFTTTRPKSTTSTSSPPAADDAATDSSAQDGEATRQAASADQPDGGGAAPAPTAAAAATGLGGIDQPPPCSSAKPTLEPQAAIKLLEAGKEPRQALRYKPRVGTRKTLTYQLNTTMNVEQGGKTAQKAGVGFTLYLDARVVESTDENSRFQFKVTRIDVPDVPKMSPKFTQGVRKELSAWKGVSGSMLVDARGLTQDVDVKGTGEGVMAAGRAHDIRVALEQTPNPLPEEPVGVGAKWQLESVVDTGLVLRGKTTFELKRLQGTRGKVSFLIDQHSDPEAGPAVCPQPGIVVRPLSWHATGRGQRTFDLGRLIAGDYETELHVTNDSRLWVKGTAQLQQVKIDMTTRMGTLK